MQKYRPLLGSHLADRIGEPIGTPAIMCPKRFEQGAIVPKWLAGIVGFKQVFLAREVLFMRSPTTRRPASRIDLVLSENDLASHWFGLEIQSVYFSGKGMKADFELLSNDSHRLPPKPVFRRRPDWRSSSAKRLMPQLQIKVPTLRQWGTKMAVAVDVPFFESIGGPSSKPCRDLDKGDVLWLVLQVSGSYELEQVHREVLSLKDSSRKLLDAETIERGEFENVLRSKLYQLSS